MCQQIIPLGLTQNTLDNYANNSFGYGRWSAQTWLIGVEESGAKLPDEFERRLDTWQLDGWEQYRLNNEQNALLPLLLYSVASGICPDYDNQTWRSLHTICRFAQCLPMDDILNQGNANWGVENGNIALIEAMPFPNPRTRVWKYENWGAFHMQTRTLCAGRYLQARMNHIFSKIIQNQPELVVLYSYSFAKNHDLKNEFLERAGLLPRIDDAYQAHFQIGHLNVSYQPIVWADNSRSLLVCIPHPFSYRFSRHISQQIGEHIYTLMQP